MGSRVGLLNSAGVASRARTRLQEGLPRFGLAMCCILAAGIDVRTRDVGVGGPASNPLELLLVVTALFLLADSVLNRYQVSHVAQSAWRASPFVCLYGAWAMFAGIAGILFYPLSLFVFRNLLPALVFFALLAHALRSPQQGVMALKVFLVAALPNALLGLCQFIFGRPYPVPLNLASAVKMDVDGTFVKIAVSGLFNHPNALSVFLMPAFLVALGLLFARVRLGGMSRLGFLLMALLCGGLLFATRAKGAWLWAAFGVFVLMWPRWLLARRFGGALLMLTTVTVISGAVLASLWMGGALSTMMTRVLLWDSAIQAMLSQPFIALFGSGQEVVWFTSARVADTQYANAHNVFLNQAVYFGLPAAVLYLGAFVWAIHAAHRSYMESADPQVRMLCHICLAALTAIAGQYFFEPAAESSGLAVELFVFMGIAGACRWRRL